MKTLSQCFFCGSSDHRLLFRGSDRVYDVAGEFGVHECQRCGLLFLNPQPEACDLAAHYPANYYAYSDEPPLFEKQVAAYKAFFSRKGSFWAKLRAFPTRHVLRDLKGGEGTKLLDVGCGAGHFLAAVKEALGFDVYGVDAFAADTTFATRHGLNVFRGTLDRATFPDDFFDIVWMSQVLEHMPEPRLAIQEVKRVLKPKGTLYIGVPQKGALLYRLYGRNWFPLEVPRHLFIPSVSNLSELLTKEGFTVRRIRQRGGSDLIASTLIYALDSALGNRKARQIAFGPHSPIVVSLIPVVQLLNWLKLADMVEMEFVKSE